MTTNALLLQGGGALGSFQVGVYQALHERDLLPEIVVGISIGAINSAIIAGNPPKQRLSKLREFWGIVTRETWFQHNQFAQQSKIHNYYSAQAAALFGQPGFFQPRSMNPWVINDLELSEYSYYDTKPLRETLLKVVDFDYLNQTDVRLSLGTVDLESGDFLFFDNQEMEILPEHIMASGALPPGFPPVKIGDRYFVDGGIFVNNPILRVINLFSDQATYCVNNVLCFMVDLFSVSGNRPRSMDGVMERVKEIQYSSRTKGLTRMYAKIQQLTHAFNMIADSLTEEQKQIPSVAKAVANLGCPHHLDIVQLIYKSDRGTELHSKDYEFSKASYQKHVDQGYCKAIDMIDKYQDRWFNCQADRGVDMYP